MKNAIEIRHLSKHYTLFDLRDVSFDVPGGAIVGLIGENGAGKSTTIKAILGLIRPDSGTVALLGRENGSGERAVREEIGVVLDPVSFHDTLTADYVGAILGRVYRTWDKGLYQSLLKRWELPRNLFLKEFSKGMRMKLSIAAALAHHPRLLILDEPTSGLDPVVRSEILDEFLAFIRDEDHSVLLSSHITSDLERVADYIVYLHKGAVALQGVKDDILACYGRVACSGAELERLDPGELLGVRRGQFGCQALVSDRAAFLRRHPGLTVDAVTLEEIMVLMGKEIEGQ